MKAALPVWVVVLLLASSAAWAQSEPRPAHHAAADNGTDPTRLSRTATVTYEHLDLLEDFRHELLRLETIFPFGAKHDWGLRVRIPVVSTDVAGDTDPGLGDVSLRLTHIFHVTRKQGFVAHGEVIFDTASRDELGGGQTVFEGTLIYARFLPHGIFAPAWVQRADIAGGDDRPDVNSTTIDFYYVPKLSTPGRYMTLDPALNFDWENDKQYASFAVTIGQVVGKAFGGNAQVYVKPSFQISAERAGDWGIEVGFKVIGF